jgi:predicted hydrocarbon binding protein
MVEQTLIPDDVLDEMINPMYIYSLKNFENYIYHKLNELRWNIDLSIDYDHDTRPSNIHIKLNGPNPNIKFIASLLSQFLVKNSIEINPFEIKSVKGTGEKLELYLSKSDKIASRESLIKFFGNKEDINIALKERPNFWKILFHMHIQSNYNMVTVHRNYFEDIILGNPSMGEVIIETLARKPVQDIAKHDMLSLIKKVYEDSRIVDRVDIDGDDISVFHSFRDIKAADKIKKSLIMILEANGHLYDAKICSNIITLRHRPEIGIKINEIVNSLKTSDSTVDQQLIVFLTFIKGLKELNDIPLYLTSLGRRIGKGLLEEYEKEKHISNWNLENFKEALSDINFKIHTDSEWELENNYLSYKIRRCNLAKESDGHFDNYICHIAREVFKGALAYAFGGRAEIEVKKLLSHGDKCCEIVIKLHKEKRELITNGNNNILKQYN